MTAYEIDQICKPLYKVGITLFTYLKNFNNGSQVYLSNNPHWIKDYYDLNLYESSQFEFDFNLYHSGYFIWPQENDSEVFLHGRNFFDSNYGITIIQRNTIDCEFYFFSGSAKTTWLNHFYLNNIDLLEKFIIYFKDSASYLLKKAEKNRIWIPRSSVNETSKLDLTCDNFFNLRNEFLQAINLKDSLSDKEAVQQLTHREKEVALSVLQGRTAKEISNHLVISRKTVERHIENMKTKLKCENKAELIKRLIVLESIK